MSLLITDSSFGVWETQAGGAAPKRVPCPFQAPCVPCAGRNLMAFCCRQGRDCQCLSRRGYAEVSRMPGVPGVSAMLLSPCERYLYQLSSEADCVHTRMTATGELLYATPTGVFPRTMRMDEGGRRLLVAGGAVDEAYVLSAPELRRERVIHTRGACFAADFWLGGLLLVCAIEGDDIQTAVYTLPMGAMRPREVIVLPGQPGGLCVCPDGQTALLSTRDGLMKLDIAAGRLMWNLPEWPLCMYICCQKNTALVSGTLSGQVCLMSHIKPWLRRVVASGADAQACFCQSMA